MDEVQKAVALKYDPSTMSAPTVVAKGVGEIAKKIVEVARKHGIPVEKNPELVDDLLRLDLFTEIPEDLYVVVAEILAFIRCHDR